MKKLVFVVFLLGQFLYASTLKDISDIEKLTQVSMVYIGEDKIEKGLDILVPYSVVSPEQLENSKKQLVFEFPRFRSHFGKVLGSEFIDKVHVGKSLCQITYIQKFEKHVLTWRFYYYKPKDTWLLNSFVTADKMDILFEWNGVKR